MARRWVGLEREEDRSGVEMTFGSCDFETVLGRSSDEMEACIWDAWARRPRRMYSMGTLASSGAAATTASWETSAKGGRARVRGSWRGVEEEWV